LAISLGLGLNGKLAGWDDAGHRAGLENPIAADQADFTDHVLSPAKVLFMLALSQFTTLNGLPVNAATVGV
jgi:hypothetical protein